MYSLPYSYFGNIRHDRKLVAVHKWCRSSILGIKNVSQRLRNINPFDRSNVDRQAGLFITPFAAFILALTAGATAGVVRQSHVLDEAAEDFEEFVNRTMHIFGIYYLDYFLL